jgi:hypothetical protein
MKHNHYILENNKTIDVFDDVFPMIFRSRMYDYAKSCNFRLGWGDTNNPDRSAYDYFLHSMFNDVDLENIKLFENLKNTVIEKILDDLTLTKTVLNCGTPSDSYSIHIHQNKKVLLYYVNLDWLDSWHGETLFYSENCKDIQFASPYTPGRLIIFDADIPHTIRPQSIVGTKYRLTLSLFYN